MPRSSPLPRLQEIAQEQWGLVTRRQIQDSGIGATSLERLTLPEGSLERAATGVYRLVVAPIPDHLELRAAWLQLAPDIPAWRRTADQGVVSHRSAASLYGLGHLPADRHEFTVQRRKQTRRSDVRIHVRVLSDGEWIGLRGLPVTRPSRIASDLLWDHEDPEAVAQLVTDSIRKVFDYPGTFADSLASHAGRFGLRKGGRNRSPPLVPRSNERPREGTLDGRSSDAPGPGLAQLGARNGDRDVTAEQRYSTPAAFRRALTDRLNAAAKDSRWTPQQLQRQVAYDRLLERMYMVDDGWILKGATALLARDLGVRGSLDIDAYRAVAHARSQKPICAGRRRLISGIGSASRSAEGR